MGKKRQKHFTLVEMLVVISVIAILASLLLPALGKARGMALQISCLNHEKQLGVAIFQYADNHDGYYGSWPMSDGANFSSYSWFQQPDMLENLGVRETVTSDLRKYPVFYCTGLKASSKLYNRPGYQLNDHVFGGFNVSAGTVTCPPLRVFNTKQPSGVSMAICGEGGGGSFSKYWFRGGFVGWNNHAGSCNMLHCDGHAENHRFTPDYGAANILGFYQNLPLIITYNP